MSSSRSAQARVRRSARSWASAVARLAGLSGSREAATTAADGRADDAGLESGADFRAGDAGPESVADGEGDPPVVAEPVEPEPT